VNLSTPNLQEFKVPEGFPEILRDFTREVLRDQPKNMEKYGKPTMVPALLDNVGALT
jgi:hypothetical protein